MSGDGFSIVGTQRVNDESLCEFDGTFKPIFPSVVAA